MNEQTNDLLPLGGTQAVVQARSDLVEQRHRLRGWFLSFGRAKRSQAQLGRVAVGRNARQLTVEFGIR